MFGFSDLVTFAADKQRIVFNGNFYEGYMMLMSKRVATLWELVERARCGEMFTREEIVKTYEDIGKMPDGWQQRLKIASGRNDEGAYHRMIHMGHDLFLVGKWDGKREIWFHDPYTLHGSVYGIERLPIEELVEGEDYHFEDEFYEFAGPGWNGDVSSAKLAKPAFDELPPRQQEFLTALYMGKPLWKYAPTRDALRRHGYITETDDWDAIELTQQGMTEVISKRNVDLEKATQSVDIQLPELTIGQTVYLKVDYNNHLAGQPLEVLGDSLNDGQWFLSTPTPTHVYVKTPGALGSFTVDVAKHISTTPLRDDQPTSEVVDLRQERDEARAKVEHVQREYRRAFGLAFDNVLTEDMPRLMADEIILQRRNRDVEQAYSDSLKARCDEQERALAEIKHLCERILEQIDIPPVPMRRIVRSIIDQVNNNITQEQAHVEQV